MTKKILLIITLSVICTLSINAQMFENLSKIRGISSVYVSKALLKLAGELDVDMRGVDIKNLIDKLDAIEIYTSTDSLGEMNLNIACDQISSDEDYQLIMKIKADGDDVAFFTKQTSNNVITDFIMFSRELNESTIIRIVGAFTVEDIQNIATKVKSY